METELERFIKFGKHTNCDRDKLQLRISTYADIYVYLFFHAARFLKPGGRMGIVTSNAWIDVNFGYLLQQFFLEHFKLIAILESRCEPWFEEASVNTIVTIAERCDNPKSRDNHVVKFVKVKRRLKELIPEDMKMEAANRWSRLKDVAGRVEACDKSYVEIKNGNVITALSGMDTEEDNDFRIRLLQQGEMREELKKAGKTVKWGQYLRAPKIFFDIQDLAGDKLCLLNEIAIPKFGSKTRINEFFHVSEEVAKSFNIENEYLLPLIKSPKETEYITVDPDQLSLKIFVCRCSKDELRSLGHMGALKYIEWGETQTYSSGTFAGLYWREGTWVKKRKPGWWALPNTEISFGQIFFSQAFGERHIHSFSPIPLIPDARLYFLSPTKGITDEEVAAVLNSSITSLFLEVTGRVTMGDGPLEMKVEDARDYLLVPRIQAFRAGDRQGIVKVFKRLLKRPISPIPGELDHSDRQELDGAILKAMELPLSLRDNIYEGLRTLVSERLQLGQMRNKAKRSRPTQAVERVRQDVIDDLFPHGLRRFPEDFLAPSILKGSFVEYELPPGKIEAKMTPLFSEITGEKTFKIQLKTAFETKFLLYAHKSGQTKVKMPAQEVEVSRAVKNYEIYLRELKTALYKAYYKRTLDQQLSTSLTMQAFETLKLPVPPE